MPSDLEAVTVLVRAADEMVEHARSRVEVDLAEVPVLSDPA